MTYDEFKQNFLPEFLNIKSFAGRMKYANQNLQRIGSGTGRVVYDIDGEKVLKLAKNQKGIAQNETEAGAGYYRDTQHIVTEVFDSADDNSWLISEKAKKVNEKRIKELTEIPSLNDLYYFLRNFKDQNDGKRKPFGQDKEIEEFFWENEFAQDLQNFIANYAQTPGDMGRPSTYGEVLRDGQPTIVLTDYGLNDEVYDTHYSPNRKPKYQMYELYNYADGNDDILSDAGGGNEIRTGIWAQMPYSVSDGGDNSNAVINEEFINFVSNRETYPDKPISGLPVLADGFHECVNNIRETLKRVENKKQFYHNLLELQNYLQEQGYYDRDPLMSEEYQINEETPKVEMFSLEDRSYADKLAKEVAGKLELSTPKSLGGGAMGFAYEIDNNLVMKLTSDISEADSASKLLRGRPEHIATVYNLYKVVDTDTDKAYFAIMQENINDKPIEKMRRDIGVIDEISPTGMSYEDIMIRIKRPSKFNYNKFVELAQHILTDNPETNISEVERKSAYDFLIGMLDIRKELLEFGIKSTDYITIGNLGYKNGELKYFDVGGYFGVTEPDITDDNIISLPENISEDYPRDRADAVALEMAQKLSVGEPKYLGAGTLGVAYDIGDNKVLKITKDNSEAYENLKLIGQPLKHIAQPYRVFEVKSDVNPDAQKTYAIILEKLKSDTPYFKRMYDRLDYAFKTIFKIDYKHVFEMYQYNDEEVGGVKRNQIDNYFKKNSEDGEFFFSILRIEEELQKYGIESVDYYNPENLGYKPSGVIGFFDVGFTDGFAQPHGAEQMSVNVAEDGSSKFTTMDAINQDEFPPYNTNDTSPSINNDLDANIAMYEDLEYNHVDGDATQDEYKLEERDKSFGSGSKTVKVKRKCQLAGLGNTSVACNQGDINNLEFGSVNENIENEKYYRVVEKNMGKTIEFEPEGFYEAIDDNGDPIYRYDTFWESDIPEVAASKTIGGAVMGLFSMFMSNGRNPSVFYVYEITEKPDVDISHWEMGDFYHLKEVRYRRPVRGKYIGKLTITDDMKIRLNAFYEMNNLEAYDEPDEETAEIFQDTDYDQYLAGVNNMVNEKVGLDLPAGDIQGGFASYKIMNDGQVVGEMELMNRDNKYLILDKIIIEKEFRGAGYANDAMKLLFDYADKQNKIITLTPDSLWGANKNKLQKWYQSLGFVVNKGRNKDFETMQLMYRLPKNLELNEYFSSLVPDMNEGEIMSLQDLPFKEEVEQLGGKIFSVGGAVRDEFLGKESKDLDILVTGIPMDELEKLLSKYGGVNAVGKSFGVLKFVPKGATEEIDIAIPRTEKPTDAGGHQGFDVTSDHALPIEKDLERRDFTINAIAKDIDDNIIDPFDGQEDLKNKIIRIVNPVAFSDDPLRMLRAVQFASRFGFVIEPTTMEMIERNAEKIKEIAPERILIELEKIVTKGNALIGVQLLANTGLFKQIFGNEIKPSQIGRRDFSGVKTMAELLFLMMNGVVQNPAEFYLTRFSTEDAKRDKVYKELQALDLAFNSDLVDQQMQPVKARSIAHNMFTTAPQTLESQVIPEQIKNAAQELLQGKYPKTVNELAVNGNDLMQKGLQGKAVGDMQKSMLIQIYGDKIRNSKEDLLSLIDNKNTEMKEGYPNYSDMQPSTWDINGKEVGIDFFIEKYDKWNKQGGSSGYRDATRESVLEFLQNNYEDESTDEKLNKELYWALTDRDLLGEEEVKRVSYSAVVLDDKSRAGLLKVLSPMIPEGWDVIAHHMTIKMGALDNGSDAQQDMENNIKISLKVIDYAMDELVMAVGVEGYPTTNPKPHITIAVNRADGGKPFFSNKLTDWKPLGFPLTLTGKVSEE